MPTVRRAPAGLLALALLAGGAGAFALSRTPQSDEPRTGEPDPSPVTTGRGHRAGPGLRWLAVGGGAIPEQNQVSIEQDLGLAARVLAGPGRVLFAAGSQAPVVQVLEEPDHPDPLLRQLGQLFNPRSGRDATYRPPSIAVDGSATATEALTELRRSLSGGQTPLLFVVAGHGLAGQQPADNTLSLWGQSVISVRDLARATSDAERPMVLVSTTCFSGGFAELVFADADPQRGVAPVVHCGLFAAPWDLEASGCDPNPVRAQQEGYALHFFNALHRADRDGRPLDASTLDLDDDGKISLLEAHTRVRIASEAADVPTTTSERWLRHVAPQLGPHEMDVDLPEEDAIIEALGARLELRGREGEAWTALQAVEDEIQSLEQALLHAQDNEELAYRAAAAELLAQWPVLDDPWHPDFGPTLGAHRDAIERVLQTSPTWAAYVQATDETMQAADRIAAARARAAPYERLARAVETRALARRLAHQGGPAWDRYRALLECERTTPDVVKSR